MLVGWIDDSLATLAARISSSAVCTGHRHEARETRDTTDGGALWKQSLASAVP